MHHSQVALGHAREANVRSLAALWLMTVATIALGAVIIRAVFKAALTAGFGDFFVRIHATRLGLGLAVGVVAWVVLRILNPRDRC